MKVNGGNGKFYTRDHPHEIISPHIMRFEEIRYWLVELRKNYGWETRALERTLGLTNNAIKRKLTVGWIWPKEQVRMSARIKEILDGYIVPRRVGRAMQGVYVDPPEPPKPKAKTLRLYASINGIGRRPPPAPNIPEVRNIFANVAEWQGSYDKKKPAG